MDLASVRGWIMSHEWIAAGAVVAVLVAWWLLRRPDPVLRRGERDLEKLREAARGRYDDLRPLK